METKYAQLCQTPSDINEHLPTLREYGSQCESILELGVRGCVSSWAFLAAKPKLLILNDIVECDVGHLLAVAKASNLDVRTVWQSDLDITLEGAVDLVFIDTYHVYGQLKRELCKFAPLCKKYIIMHDTEVDKVKGECIRQSFNAHYMVQVTGIPYEEHMVGLQPAIEEFLAANPAWEMHKKFTNNNGLTILKRVS